MNIVNQIVADFLSTTAEKIKNNIRTKSVTEFGAMDNTGQAADSIKWKIEGDRGIIYSEMSGQFNYIWTLETGRKAGKMPPTAPILAWVKQRGINPPDISQESLAYLIARRIGREGSKLYRQGGNSGVLTDFANEKYIKENLTDKLIEALSSEMIKEYS